MAKDKKDIDELPSPFSFDNNDVSASGYYLESYLRLNGYDTFLVGNDISNGIRHLERCNPFTICISTTMILYREDVIKLVDKIRMQCGDVSIW